MVWKYRECLPDVPLARDIPKIGKFKATNSLRVSCLLEFARHGHNLMGVSPIAALYRKRTADGNGVRSDSASKGSLRQSTDLTYRNLILRHMSVVSLPNKIKPIAIWNTRCKSSRYKCERLYS